MLLSRETDFHIVSNSYIHSRTHIHWTLTRNSWVRESFIRTVTKQNFVTRFHNSSVCWVLQCCSATHQRGGPETWKMCLGKGRRHSDTALCKSPAAPSGLGTRAVQQPLHCRPVKQTRPPAAKAAHFLKAVTYFSVPQGPGVCNVRSFKEMSGERKVTQ